ncbi:hypothetical protein CMV_023932 [Castanea mollissima]|uniref:Growth-regulating factor n=1 Tax=Castanea mollissima TaxID=60419 RepID=A0A8J4QBF2_9ROSI|nr:hypothetical protein CMV_023932 [Castanea mollissima]
MIRMDSLDFVDKEAKRETSSVKPQSNNTEETFTNKVIMFHHGNHNRPFSSPSPSFEVKVGDGDGPTCKNRSIISDDIYDVVVGRSGSASAFAVTQQHTSGGAGVRTVQAFDTATTPHTASKSPVRMAASLGFPFTSAQWRELERQAMIYKYMMASAPIPPELLIPTYRNTSDPAASHSRLGGSGFNLRLSNGTDPEPGRCKRTDGKKWRCSRDVAPDHKYCERHLHRGRPRSRKPVEIHAKNENIINSNNNSSNNNNIIKRTRREDYHVLPTTSPLTMAYPNPTINTNGFPSQFLGPAQPYHQPTVASHKEPWGLDWMVKGAYVPTATSDQQWYPMMETKVGFTSGNSFPNTNAPVFKQRYAEEPLNLNLYECFRNYEHSRNKDCTLSFNSDMVSTQKPDTGTTRGFIDAWSNSITQENIANSSTMCTVSPNGRRLSPSSLTLSVGGGNSIGEEMGKFPMGLGLFGRDQSNDNGTKSHLTNWLTPASSVSSTPGGPLAEVLRPSIAGAASNSSSPTAGNGDSGSSPVTMASSPSGVLQRTLPSLSDSSGNSSSSTIGSSAVNPEMALLWLN